MVLLALPPADHLLIERDRGQFVPSRRRRMMASVRAEGLLKIPVEPSPELRPRPCSSGCFRPRAHGRALTAAEAAVLPYKNAAPEGADPCPSRSTAACSAYSRAAICYADANSA